MKHLVPPLSLLILGLVLSATFPSRAQARRGLVVVNSGQDVFEAGPLPAPYATHPDLVGFQAGYQCDVYGVFWIYFSISNCRPVAFNEATDQYVDAPEVVAAVQAAYQESDMKLGFWKGYMRYLVLLLGLLIGGMLAYGKFGVS
jgi:hypothetical protein